MNINSDGHKETSLWLMSFLLVAVVGTAAGSSGSRSLLLLPTDVLTHAAFHIKGSCWKTDKIVISKNE